LTVATAALLVCQFKMGFVAFAGSVVAISAVVVPPSTNAAVGSVICVISVGGAVTVTAVTLDVMLLPSVETAVICVDPLAMLLTTPDALTVATAGLLEFQASCGLFALLGSIAAVSVAAAPV
jgi:hypothetical protein